MQSVKTWIFLFCLPNFIHAGILSKKLDTKYEWDLVTEVNVSGVLPVHKYKSRRTGLTVVLSSAETPLVNGYICLPTETFTNDGLPHTLEHLVFLGSEDYPYKEVLDLSANRCLADRTNAWTDTDHTCYTVYTAGSGGFMNILPVYMDHILYPLLREEDFMTEVHHISGKGEDAGVVYSEMQGVENKDTNILYYAMAKKLYPGNSSYHFQTGGVLKNLRESTTIEKVRAYHKQFYRPENLYITVTGNIKSEQIFDALRPVEEKILRKRKSESELEPYVKPFQTKLDPLTEDVTVRTEYPSKDERFGSVTMGWRMKGQLYEAMPSIQALNILGGFLSSSPISPLQLQFVELSSPLATDVDMLTLLNSEAGITLKFENVPLEKMDLIDGQFKEFMKEALNKGTDFIDMTRIHTIIQHMKLSRQKSLENSPHTVVPDASVLDMLYSSKPEHFKMYLTKVDDEVIDRLMNNTQEYWLNLMNETFTGPRVLLLAYPSQEYDSQLMFNETKRVAKQVESLGEEGLHQAGEKIASAVKSQRLPPSEVLNSIPVADADLISYRNFKSYNYTTKEQPPGFDLRSIPFRFHVDDARSQFMRFYIFFDLSGLPEEDMPYLVLLNTLWFQCPLKHSDSGDYESLEEVIMRRSRDTLSTSTSMGFRGSIFVPGSNSHLMMFSFEAHQNKFEESMKLFRETLHMVEFTEERARTVILQLLNSIPGEKLSSATISNSISDNIFFNSKTNYHHSSIMRQQRYLSKALEMLSHNPATLIGKLHEIKKAIIRPENSFGFMSADLERLQDKYGGKSEGIISSIFEGYKETSPEDLGKRFKLYSEYEYKNPKPKHNHIIVGLPGSESCFMKQGIPFEITDWEHEDVATVRVMLQYMTDRMYDKIRGKGWTYGVTMAASVTEGRILLNFIRSSHMNNAYMEFRNIITNYTQVEKTSENFAKYWDPVLIESARGSQIYSWVEREEAVADLSSISVKAYLRGTWDSLYNRRFVKRLAKVSLEDVHRVASKYLPRFLDANETQTAVVCNPLEVPNIKYIFGHYNINLFEIEDIENSILSH